MKERVKERAEEGVYATWLKLRIATLRDQLQEVDEVLTEQGWHTDRGLLKRVRDVLADQHGDL